MSPHSANAPRVLITGGAGFIGHGLSLHLAEQGYAVTVLDNLSRGRHDAEFKRLLAMPNVAFVDGDITDSATFRRLDGRYDFVYHLAAINGTSNFYKMPDKVLKVGAFGIINMLEWFAKQPSGKLLFSSTSEAYAGALNLLGSAFPIPTPENVPLVVEDPANVRWSYGSSKIFSEVAMHAYAKARDMKRFVIVRYHNIYGPRMGFEHVIPQFIERIVNREEPFKIYGGSETRTFCYVDDALRATQLVMENSSTDGQTIHIGRSDHEISILDMANMLFSIADVKPQLSIQPSPPGSVGRRCPDTTKLRALGFEPTVSLEDGLGRCYASYKNEFAKRDDLHEGTHDARGDAPPASSNGPSKEAIFALISDYMAVKPRAFVPGVSQVSVGWPCYGSEEIISAVDSLLDLRITQGEKVATFERNYAAYVGTTHGVAVNSGSSANLIALAALVKAGRVKPGAEVIVPAATFTTVISPILQNGLVPVFVDVDEKTYNILPEAIEQAIGSKTGLIMPVHSLGCPADMEAIMAIARRNNLPVLEDCCEAHSARINGKMVGSFGALGTYSFFVAHNMTTGEGGMITTSDDELTALLRSMREFGRRRTHDTTLPRFSYSDTHLSNYDERYVFELIGYNVRMSDVHASLGIEQLKKLEGLNQRRLENVAYFNSRLARHGAYLQLPTVPEGMLHTFYGYTLFVRENAPFTRTQMVRFLEQHRIETRAFMGGNLAVQPAYRGEATRIAGKLTNTERIANSAFFIGCHPQIGADERQYAMDVFDEFIDRSTAL